MLHQRYSRSSPGPCFWTGTRRLWRFGLHISVAGKKLSEIWREAQVTFW